MTLVEEVRAALAAGAAGQRIEAREASQEFTCDLAAIDSLACAFTSFALATDRLAGATPDELKRLGEKLSARLTYLLEPISPVEIDHGECVVQMRSSPPQRDEDRTSYYELVIRRGGALRLCRYAKAPGDVRQIIPAHVTREVFLRLVGDFSAVVA
ncbi:MAG: hypothetical protein HYX69_11505 [Planctomycetia bacterium]|nr:hypothetical protein [Planctomycetia bacterium]